MKHALLWILGIVLALAVTVVVLLSRIDTAFVVNQIADITARATGKPLVFSSAPRLSFLPPGVEFGEARWGQISDGQGLAVSVKGGMAELELLPLLSGNLVMREMRLDNPTLELREGKTVSAQTQQQANARNAPPESSVKAPGDLPVELKRLVARQGRIVYADAQGRSVRVKDLNLSVENLYPGQEATVQCDFAFDLAQAQPAPQGAKTAGNLAGNLALSARLLYSAPQLAFRQVSLTITPLEGFVPKEAGPVQLSCQGTLDLQSLNLSLSKARCSTPLARLALSGEAAFNPPAFKGALDMEASPRKLAALAGQPLKPAPAGGKDILTFKSTLEYVQDTLHLRQIAIRLDDTPLSGDLSLDLAGLPAVSGDLQMGLLDLDNYLPLPGKAAARGSNPERSKAKADLDKTPASSTAATRIWPAVNLRAAVAGVRQGKLLVKDISFILKGKKGRYDLSSFACALGGGGALKASGTADLAAGSFALKAAADGVRVGALLEALDLGRPMDGTAALRADLTLRGDTARAMQAGLNGSGVLEVRNVQLSAMSALPGNVPGLTDKRGAVPDRFDLVRVPFTARNGEITAQPVTVTSAGLNARGRVQASLPRQYFSATGDIKTLGMNIPVVAKGPFNNISYGVDPKFALDVARKLPGLLNRGRTGGSAAEKTGQDAPRGADAVRGLMEGLFGR